MITPAPRPQRPLQTERLYLRSIDPEGDAEDVFEWFSLTEPLKYTTQSPHLSSSTTITFLQARKARPTFLMYAITLPLPNPSPSGKTHKVIGLLGAKAFPEIGYSLSPHYQGKGYMTEALRAFLPEMFAAMPTKAQGGWDEVLALVDTDHRASMRLLERTGFKPGEVTKGEYFSKVLGERRDGKAFRLARPGTEGGGTEVVEAQQGEAI